MPERVTVREDLQITHVESYGDVTAEDLKASLKTVLALYEERGLLKVFVDASKETSLPKTFPLFEFGAELSEALRAIQFAVVTSPQVRDDLRFLENVTRNRGMQVRMFDTEDEALAWLVGKSD